MSAARKRAEEALARHETTPCYPPRAEDCICCASDRALRALLAETAPAEDEARHKAAEEDGPLSREEFLKMVCDEDFPKGETLGRLLRHDAALRALLAETAPAPRTRTVVGGPNDNGVPWRESAGVLVVTDGAPAPALPTGRNDTVREPWHECQCHRCNTCPDCTDVEARPAPALREEVLEAAERLRYKLTPPTSITENGCVFVAAEDVETILAALAAHHTRRS